MESYIQISQLNDFIFCPRSIYFHNLYKNYKKQIYHTVYQTKGSLAHKNIEERNYSSLKKYKQNMAIYSDRYRLCGKVDIYDTEENTIIEYKNKINEIYDGQKYQLYGQYFCLCEMGYQVDKIFLYSKSDNKKYIIDIPDQIETNKFECLIKKINTYDILKDDNEININKCIKCIYNNLCNKYVDIT